jgi:hypothetical protein
MSEFDRSWSIIPSRVRLRSSKSYQNSPRQQKPEVSRFIPLPSILLSLHNTLALPHSRKEILTMSEIKLNLLDSHSLLTATVHGSVGDALVAALSAEPETIDELVAAFARFKKGNSIPASSLHRGEKSAIDEVPYDAGILVIDLASRMVACESTYCFPTREGSIDIYDRSQEMGVTVRYALADDWMFLRSIEQYQTGCKNRLAKRSSAKQFDARSIIYGEPLLDFIAQNAKLLASPVSNVRRTSVCRPMSDIRLPSRDLPDNEATENTTALEHSSPDIDDNQDQHHDLLYQAVLDIHRRWLMTQRNDLNGASPREIIFAKQKLINTDLESRMFQWSFFLEEPPALSRDTNAYKLAGFGTHEWVMYHYLVRYLIWEAVELITQDQPVEALSDEAHRKSLPETIADPASSLDSSSINVPSPDAPISFSPSFSSGLRFLQQVTTVSTASSDSSLVTQLEQLKSQWLSNPNPEFSGIPAEVIDNERRRRPEALTGRSMVVDEDCPCCKMMGDESEAGIGIYFTHYDGCNMEDEFAFSWHATLEEWEEEQRRNEEWERERIANAKAKSSTNQVPEEVDIPF